MSSPPITLSAEQILIEQIRRGEPRAWEECIRLYEGRLTSFCRSRIKSQTVAEDLVQETFIGFLISLPNYRDETPLEQFLFSIAAHKIIDHLRKQSRRGGDQQARDDSDFSLMENISAKYRQASSLARSKERKSREAVLVAGILQNLIIRWKEKGEYERLKCMELLFVLDWKNKEVAQHLKITEQDVANHKLYVMQKLKEAAQQAAIHEDALQSLFPLE
jgi:RNA polymerase sigma-70 factor (ECF subfamily)